MFLLTGRPDDSTRTMFSSFTLLAVVLVFSPVLCVRADLFFPPSCASTCAQGEFISKLPVTIGPVADGENRAYAWAIVALIQMKLNFDIISPPAAGRISAIVGSCLYEAAALNQNDYLSDTECAFKFPNPTAETMTHAMDGAAFWALRSLFGDRASFSRVIQQYQGFSGDNITDFVPEMEFAASFPPSIIARQVLSNPITRESAMQLGVAVCQCAIEKYTADGFTARGDLGNKPNPASYQTKNKAQQRAGITDCDNEIVDANHWQPLCVPMRATDFGTRNCVPQTFLYPWAGQYAPYALQAGDENMGFELIQPPPTAGTPDFREQWEQVLQLSGELDDCRKIVAEYWADGPETTQPAGHFWKIAVDAARSEQLSPAETARLLSIIGNAVYDAGIASWRTKTSFDFCRPLQMIQCGEYRGQIRRAWKGPYEGVGSVNMSEWRPYQATTFVTPAFAAYTSGHSTFSAAAAEALRLFFGDDIYRGPSCDRILEGESLFEPRSDAIPGMTNVPNRGPDTPGYVPAEDVVLCWQTFSAASEQSGKSRLYGGIHIKADDVAGQNLGRRIGGAVFKKANRLRLAAFG